MMLIELGAGYECAFFKSVKSCQSVTSIKFLLMFFLPRQRCVVDFSVRNVVNAIFKAIIF